MPVKNTTKPSKKIESIPLGDINTHLYKNQKTVIDFSFEGAFVSCKTGDFDNHLKNQQEFIEKFRLMMVDVHNLSQKSLYELISNAGYRHCHLVSSENKAMGIIRSVFNTLGSNESSFEQIVGGETIFQLGLQSEVRLFGTINGNIFRVYFIDYHHDYEFDKKRNNRNKRYCNFCAVNSIVE